LQNIFNYDDIPDKELNIFTYRTPSYVIICNNNNNNNNNIRLLQLQSNRYNYKYRTNVTQDSTDTIECKAGIQPNITQGLAQV